MATIACSARVSRWARRWSTGACRAPTSTAAEPPQRRRSAARPRLRWNALPCGRIIWATVSRSVRSSTFRRHHRASSWARREYQRQNGGAVAYETAGGCGCASYAVIGQSIAGWGVMSPDATVPHAMPWPQHTGFWQPSTSNCSILLGREAHRHLQRSPWVPQAVARHRLA